MMMQRRLVMLAALCAVALAANKDENNDAKEVIPGPKKGPVFEELKTLFHTFKSAVEKAAVYAACQALSYGKQMPKDYKLKVEDREELKIAVQNGMISNQAITPEKLKIESDDELPTDAEHFIKQIQKEGFLGKDAKTFSLRFEGDYDKDGTKLRVERTWVFSPSPDDGYVVTNKWNLIPEGAEDALKAHGFENPGEIEEVKMQAMEKVMAYILYIQYYSMEATGMHKAHPIICANNTGHPLIIPGNALDPKSLVWLWVLLAIFGAVGVGFSVYWFFVRSKSFEETDRIDSYRPKPEIPLIPI